MGNSSLNIAFDGKRALFNQTGLGNYSRYAIETLIEVFPGNSYSIYSHKYPAQAKISWLADHPEIKVQTPQSWFGRHFSWVWRHYGGMAAQIGRDGINIYHGLSNELPLDIAKSGIPSVVTIHDLIFRRIPDNYKPIDRQLYDFKFRHAAANATRVIAISEHTKSDIVELYGISPDKIDVIYQGCSPVFNETFAMENAGMVKRLYNLPERYIVMVGTVEQRKNQILAVEALPALPKDIKLVIVGRERNSYGRMLAERISRLGLGQRVLRLTGVPTEHLPALYRMAQFAAYPSRYEGFGLPIIEAINSGTPVIAATGSCLEEAGGPGALYVHPDYPEEFAAQALRLIEDSALRRDMVAAGQGYTARFSRPVFAARVMDTYGRAIGGFC